MRCVRNTLWLGLALAVGVALAGCGGKGQTLPPLDNTYFTDFEPVTPEIAPVYTDYSTYAVGQAFPQKTWASRTSEEIRSLLSEKDVSLTVQRYNAQGKLTYLAASAHLDIGQYIITLNSIRFRPERVQDGAALCQHNANCKPLEMIQMGVGARLVAEVNVTEGGLNTGGLLPLGLDTGGKRVSGKLRLNTIGVVPRKTGLSLPALSLTVDDSSIQAMLKAIAVLETQIEGVDVELTPFILGVKSLDPPRGPVEDGRTLKLDAGVKGFSQKGMDLLSRQQVPRAETPKAETRLTPKKQ
jgi:hypothetical protein